MPPSQGAPQWPRFKASASVKVSQLLFKFGVWGSMPAMVLLDASATMVAEDGFGILKGDPTGRRFPWPSLVHRLRTKPAERSAVQRANVLPCVPLARRPPIVALSRSDSTHCRHALLFM